MNTRNKHIQKTLTLCANLFGSLKKKIVKIVFGLFEYRQRCLIVFHVVFRMYRMHHTTIIPKDTKTWLHIYRREEKIQCWGKMSSKYYLIHDAFSKLIFKSLKRLFLPICVSVSLSVSVCVYKTQIQTIFVHSHTITRGPCRDVILIFISQKILWNGNCSPKTVNFWKMKEFLNLWSEKLL